MTNKDKWRIVTEILNDFEWGDLKDRLHDRATSLQLEQQQKLCIARLLPLKPEVILMDEPCSSLDVEGTRGIEELMFDLRGEYTIVIVTHNMQQAQRSWPREAIAAVRAALDQFEQEMEAEHDATVTRTD